MDDLIDLRSMRPEATPDLSNKTAIRVLQMEYRGEIELTPAQRRSAMACLPFESPKLAVTAYVADTDDFAARLERALARSHKAGLIEHRGEGDGTQGTSR
jgi:hypothetical protein